MNESINKCEVEWEGREERAVGRGQWGSAVGKG